MLGFVRGEYQTWLLLERSSVVARPTFKDFRVGFLAVREANWCYQSFTQFAWKQSERMYEVKGFGFFFLRKEIGLVEKVVNNLSVIT